MRATKSLAMSIRVSESELEKLKAAAEKLSYSSYSEFVRRTALIEAARALSDKSEDSLSESKHSEGGK